MKKRTVVIGLAGSTLDAGLGPERWERWRPSVALFQHEDLLIDRLELLCEPRIQRLRDVLVKDIASVSPETVIRTTEIDFQDPWDLEEVYAKAHDYAKAYDFDPDQEDYLIHITTGSHVWQICLFLLTEARYLPGKLIQTSPPRARGRGDSEGFYRIIDLDLSNFDRLAARFHKEHTEAISLLKSGIETRNEEFNRMITQIEKVAIVSKDPIVLMGPTGAGKSQLARRIYQLKKQRRQLSGAFVEVTCSTLRGDSAMSALFGHVRGAFTGAASDRAGYLRTADGGVLFLDEIGELGLDEQAILLRCIEDHVFFPVGSDKEVRSEFQLLAGTNRDLSTEVAAGRFREDLLARINLWTFRLPGLASRHEDIEPNLDYELEQYARRNGTRISFNKEARRIYLEFATSPGGIWSANFRDLGSSVTRMATLAPGGRISVEVVKEELVRLRQAWTGTTSVSPAEKHLQKVLGDERIEQLDEFDRVQLAHVLQVCLNARNLSDAGRRLFRASRSRRSSINDADRLRKYLTRFGLDWDSARPRD
jgi:transcriptional regulatory protein RtcR